jgi:hypothetical protein
LKIHSRVADIFKQIVPCGYVTAYNPTDAFFYLIALDRCQKPQSNAIKYIEILKINATDRISIKRNGDVFQGIKIACISPNQIKKVTLVVYNSPNH